MGLWLSLAAVLLGMSLLLIVIEYFAVTRFLTGGFKPGRCVVMGFMRVTWDKSTGSVHEGCTTQRSGGNM